MERESRGNIILSGFMGSGKTTVGRVLARALRMRFVDMDRYIEERAGKTVREIFADEGEARFRALEAETVRELAKGKRYVVASGGGTLMNPENVRAFREGGGTVYFLDVPAAALKERLKNDKKRPLLQVPDRGAVIDRLLAERRPKYLAGADRTVEAGAPVSVVARRIAEMHGVSLPESAFRTRWPVRRGGKRGKERA